MKQISIIVLAVTMCFGLDASAAVNAEDAIAAAKSFLQKSAKSSGRQLKPGKDNLSVASENELFYNVTRGGDGFVLVAKGDATGAQVIGYSDTGSFDPSGDPCAYLSAAFGTRDASSFVNDNIYGAVQAVEPLLGDIKWDQGNPYNRFCPGVKEVDPNTPYYGFDGRCPTGCVPTAIGQVLAAKKIPSSYNWDIIQNSYGEDAPAASEESIYEVARLLHDIGVTLGADYSPLSTSAYSANIKRKLPQAMGLSDEMIFWNAEKLPLSARRSIIQEELRKGSPVFLSGASKTSSAGHAFVCDGIDENGWLHINWGWSGGSDGWYHPFVLDPIGHQGIGSTGSSYSGDYFDIVTDVREAKADDAVCREFAVSAFRISSASGSSLRFDMSVRAGSEGYGFFGYSYGFDGSATGNEADWGVIIADSDGNRLQNIKGTWSGSTLSLEIAGVDDGTYRIYPAWSPLGKNDWRYLYPLNWSDGASPYMRLDVTGGNPSVTDIFGSLTDFAFDFDIPGLPAKIDPFSPLELEVTLGSRGKRLVEGFIGVRFIDEVTGAETQLFPFFNRDLSLEYGQKERFSLNFTDLFFWHEGASYWYGNNANTRFDADHTYTLEIYVGNSGGSVKVLTSPGHRILYKDVELANVKDAAIRKILSGADLNSDGYISVYEQNQLTEITIKGSDATELSDFSMIRKLQYVTIENMPYLEKVNISGISTECGVLIDDAPKLRSVECAGNPLMYSLALWRVPMLEKAVVKDMPGLEGFAISNEALTSERTRPLKVDLVNLPKLQSLSLHDLDIELTSDNIGSPTYLDVRAEKCKGKLELQPDANYSYIYLSGLTVKEADLSGSSNLHTLFLENVGLEKLLLPADAPNMSSIYLNGNRLTSLEIPEYCSGLHDLRFSSETLEEVTLPSTLDNLEELKLYQLPNLKKITLPSSMKNAKYVVVSETGLEEFTIHSGLENVQAVYVNYNPNLGSLRLDGTYPNLYFLMQIINNKSLKSVHIGDLPALQELIASRNYSLSDFSIGNAPAMTELSLSYNALTSVDLSKAPNLETIYLGGNKLQNVDVSHLNGKLKKLYLYGNDMLFYNPPFRIEDLTVGGYSYRKIPAEGLEVPEGMDLSKVVFPDYSAASYLKDGRIMPGYDSNAHTVSYKYVDEAMGVNADFIIMDEGDMPYPERTEVGIPLGEEGVITVRRPYGTSPVHLYGDEMLNPEVDTWRWKEPEYINPEEYEQFKLQLIGEEEEWTEYPGVKCYKWSTITTIHYRLRRIKEGDVTVRFTHAENCYFDVKVTSERSAVEEIAAPGIGSETSIDYSLPYEVYTLAGQRVSADLESLPRGIYIVRQNSRTSKIAL